MTLPVLGLDVGTTKIAAVIGRPSTEGDSWEIIGAGKVPSQGLRKAVVVDIDRTVASITQAVRAAENMAGVRVRHAVVGITGGHISSLNSKAQIIISHPDGLITAEDVERVEENARTINLPPDYEIINAIPRYYTIDEQTGISNPVGMFGRRLEVETHVVIGLRTLSKNLEKCVDQAGLATEATVLEPVATARAVLSRDEMDLGVVLLDIGGGTTDIALFAQGSICFTASVPLGGANVTRDVAAGLRTSLSEAERLKLEHGCALADMVAPEETVHFRAVGVDADQTVLRRLLAEVVEARMEEVFTYVRRELAKCPQYRYVGGGIVLSGGGSLLEGAPDLCSRVLDGLSARISIPRNLTGLVNEVSNPIHATAVGLMMCAPQVAHREPAPWESYPRRLADLLRSLWSRLLKSYD